MVIQTPPKLEEELQAVAAAQIKNKVKSRRTWLAIAGTIFVLVAAMAWWLHASSIQETDDAFITGHVHQLSSRVAGTVIKVAVQDNQHVDAQQLLIKIDPRDFQINADASKAATLKAQRRATEARYSIVCNSRTAEARRFDASYAIASATAQINKAKFSLDGAKSGVDMAKAQVQQRQAELTRADSDFNRYQALVQDRAVTVQSFETAKQNKQVAEANLKVAEENLSQAQARVEEFKQALADAQATLVRVRGADQTAAAATAQTETSKQTMSVEQAAAKQAESEYENALLQLSYTDVVAPISGTIGHKTVEVGQQIERGQALMSIISDEKWVVANFKETQLEKMRVGQMVDIKIDAFPNKHFSGKVDSIAPASGAQFALLPPDNATGNFTKVVQRVSVKIVFDPDSIKGYEMYLTPGMSVVPEVHVRK